MNATPTTDQPRTYENMCHYCYTKFTGKEPRIYCSDTCKRLDREDFEEYERLKESGFYSNIQD